MACANSGGGEYAFGANAGLQEAQLYCVHRIALFLLSLGLKLLFPCSKLSVTSDLDVTVVYRFSYKLARAHFNGKLKVRSKTYFAFRPVGIGCQRGNQGNGREVELELGRTRHRRDPMNLTGHGRT